MSGWIWLPEEDRFLQPESGLLVEHAKRETHWVSGFEQVRDVQVTTVSLSYPHLQGTTHKVVYKGNDADAILFYCRERSENWQHHQSNVSELLEEEKP